MEQAAGYIQNIRVEDFRNDEEICVNVFPRVFLQFLYFVLILTLEFKFM